MAALDGLVVRRRQVIRIDSGVHLMVATESDAAAIEDALKRGPLPLMTSDDVAQDGENILVLVLKEAESESDSNAALRMLG